MKTQFAGTMTQTEIATAAARIKELEATDRALVGSDEGTHGKPGKFNLYEEITGERYAVYSFGNANGSRCPVQEALDETEGYMRFFGRAEREMRAKQSELRGLRDRIRKAGR